MKDSEVFREARNVLFERGWHRGSLESQDDGSVCVNGACNVAWWGKAEPNFEDSSGYDFDPLISEAAISHEFGWQFNDHPDTSLDDVLGALDRAEKIAEQREADGH